MDSVAIHLLLQLPCCSTEKGTGGISGPLLFGVVVGTWSLAHWAWSAWEARGVTKVNRVKRLALVVLFSAAVAGAIMVARGTSTSAPEGLSGGVGAFQCEAR